MSIAAPTRLSWVNRTRMLKPVLLLGYFGLLFLLLLFPSRTLEYDAAKVAARRLVNYEAFYQAQTNPDGRVYAWTRPQARLYFNDVPRYAPLQVQLELNFDRPGDMPPAQLQISEIRQREASPPLANLKANPSKPGFQIYSLVVPPCFSCETGLTLELNANGFKPAGDSRVLGVVTGHFGLKLGPGHYRYLLWPQPYLLAVLVLGLALVVWLERVGGDWLAGGLWLTPPALILAMFSPVLYDDSWWLVGLAGIALVAALSGKFLPVPVALLLTGAALIAIFAIIPLYATDIKDLQLYQGWIKDLQRYGPINIYNNSPYLDYLPLLLYLLWFYNLLTAPFGLSGDALSLKLFFGLPVLVNLWLLWRLMRPKFSPEASLKAGIPLFAKSGAGVISPALLVLGLSSSLIFNAAVWGQTDTLLACLLIWTLTAIQAGRPVTAGLLLGLDVALKPQSWVVAPMLALLLLRYYSWRKAIIAGGSGLGLVLGLSAPAFGFDWNSVQRFFLQPAFGGELNVGSVNAYNLLYLLGYGNKEAPTLVAWAGFAVIGLVYLLVAGLIWWRPGPSERTRQALAAALVLTVFFLGAIKMRERYLEYGLVFAGLAALYGSWQNRRGLLWAFLGLDLLSILNLLPVFIMHRNERDYNTLFFWHELVLASWLPGLVAVAITLTFGYLGWEFVKPDRNQEE